MNKAFELWQWENEPSAETPLSAEFLNRLNNGLNEIDNRVINQNTTKLDVTTANTMVKDITFDSASGIFTITKLNGSTVKIDTKLEKLAVNFEFDSNTQTLKIILEDGTTQTVDLSTLITQYEFAESDTIVLTVGSDGKVTAKIKFGSITGNMLEPNYLANVTTQADNAIASAQIATAQADRATSEADRAESAADKAESIVGGDFATNQKVDAIIDGTTPVGNASNANNADKLDGHNLDYFAKSEYFNVDSKGNFYMQSAKDSNGNRTRATLIDGKLHLIKVISDKTPSTEEIIIITEGGGFITENELLAYAPTRNELKEVAAGADIKAVAEDTSICPMGCVTYLRMYQPTNAPYDNGDFYVTVKKIPGLNTWIKVTLESVGNNNTYHLSMANGAWGEWEANSLVNIANMVSEGV